MTETPSPPTPGPQSPHPENPGPESPTSDSAFSAAPSPETDLEGAPGRAVVRDDPDRHRFDVLVGDHRAGFSMYKDVDFTGVTQRIFFHTLILDAFAGRGLASTLTRTALEQTVREGKRIVPVCTYVARWVEHHEEAAGHVDPVLPEHLEAIKDA